MIANLAHSCVDTDHVHDIKTRKSVSRIIAVIHGVVVHWTMAEQTYVAAHSADVEIGTFCTAIQFNTYLQCVLQLFCHDMTKLTTIYKDNQAALNSMAAGYITSRAKYPAVPKYVKYA